LQLGRWRCFFWTCLRGAGVGDGGEYRWVSRLGLLIGNRWTSRRDQIPAVLEYTNCSRHATVGVHQGRPSRRPHLVQCLDCLLSSSAVFVCEWRVEKRMREGRWAVWLTGLTHRPFTQSNDAAFR